MHAFICIKATHIYCFHIGTHACISFSPTCLFIGATVCVFCLRWYTASLPSVNCSPLLFFFSYFKKATSYERSDMLDELQLNYDVCPASIPMTPTIGFSSVVSALPAEQQQSGWRPNVKCNVTAALEPAFCLYEAWSEVLSKLSHATTVNYESSKATHPMIF